MHRIDSSIFNHPRFDAIVTCTTVETYLQHADLARQDLDLDAALRDVGAVISTIREINDLEFEIMFTGTTEFLELQLAGKITDLNEKIENFPDSAYLDELILTCDYDIFLEVLMSNIRNALISFQTWIRKVENAKCNSLIKQLNTLKVNYLENYNEIANLELKLTEIADVKLSEKIKQIKIYECLHDEKPSPLFLTLAKNRGKTNLKEIKNTNGEGFESDEARFEFIRSEFEKTFKTRDVENSIDYDSCIQEFLGPDIVSHPVVQNSMLTDAEAELLDAPLTLSELDESINSANMRSAAGFDGYSNTLIKKCWVFFRRPLLKYFNCCLGKKKTNRKL
jgi:hypothetical protein